MDTVNFTGDCGQCKTQGRYNSATTPAPGIHPNGPSTVTVNGKPMQNCVIGNCSAYISNIQLATINGSYQYQLQVMAAGPKCWDAGSFYFAVEDEAGDIYYINIYSSSLELHTIDFNSANPNIVAIYWSDYSFTVSTSAVTGAPTPKAKAKFRTTSPAA